MGLTVSRKPAGPKVSSRVKRKKCCIVVWLYREKLGNGSSSYISLDNFSISYQVLRGYRSIRLTSVDLATKVAENLIVRCSLFFRIIDLYLSLTNRTFARKKTDWATDY